MKQCNKCFEIKERSKFYKRIDSSDGLYAYCISCKLRAGKLHYKCNKKQYAFNHRKYNKNNREKVNANQRKYYREKVNT